MARTPQYRDRVRCITSTLTRAEYDVFAEKAKAEGLPVSTFATKLLRAQIPHLAPVIDPDNFEDSALVYGDDTEPLEQVGAIASKNSTATGGSIAVRPCLHEDSTPQTYRPRSVSRNL